MTRNIDERPSNSDFVCSMDEVELSLVPSFALAFSMLLPMNYKYDAKFFTLFLLPTGIANRYYVIKRFRLSKLQFTGRST